MAHRAQVPLQHWEQCAMWHQMHMFSDHSGVYETKNPHDPISHPSDSDAAAAFFWPAASAAPTHCPTLASTNTRRSCRPALPLHPRLLLPSSSLQQGSPVLFGPRPAPSGCLPGDTPPHTWHTAAEGAQVSARRTPHEVTNSSRMAGEVARRVVRR